MFQFSAKKTLIPLQALQVSISRDKKSTLPNQIILLQDRCKHIEEENKALLCELNTIEVNSSPDATWENFQLVIKRFSLAALNFFQYLRSVLMTLVKIKKDIKSKALKQRQLRKLVYSLEKAFATFQLLESSASEHFNTN